MNPEVTVTLKIAAMDGKIIVTAVQTAAGEDQVLEIVSQDAQPDTADLDIPPPPQLLASESLESVDLPPVPEIDEAVESAIFESLAVPDLPPVPEVEDPELFEAFESMAVPELPPVPEVPQDELFE